MTRLRGDREPDGIQILLSREDNPHGAPCSNETITSSSRGSRLLFPSSPMLFLANLLLLSRVNPRENWSPEPELGVTEQGNQFRFHFGITPLSGAHTWCSPGTWDRPHAPLQGLSFIKVLKPGQATTCTQQGCLDHLKDERLDLDGVWCSAQRLCSPAPSPFALPLGCLSCLVDAQTAAPSPCANDERWASPWCHQKGMGMEVCEVQASNPQCVQLLSPCQDPRDHVSPGYLHFLFPPDSNLLKPVHRFQALQLDLFILAVISLLSSAYKFQGHPMLTLG